MIHTSVSRRNIILVGLSGSLALLAVFFGIMLLSAPLSFAIDTFKDKWYLKSALVIGFGLQAGIFYFLHASMRAVKHASATASMATSGGVSSASMVACCAHHLTDVVPFLGISAATAFMAKYQDLFVLFGVLSNAIGIVFMLSIIQKAGLSDNELLKKYDMRQAVKAVGVIAVFVFLAAVVKEIGG